MRGDGAEDLVFGETDCARCGGGNPAAHGRESDSIVGGTLGAIGTCGADCGDYTAMVSRAGLVATRPPSHFVATQRCAVAVAHTAVPHVLGRTELPLRAIA